MLNMEREELPLALLSALFFFLILCGYFFLRPVRDAMGVAGGMDQLRWLFVLTSIVSLTVVLVFGGVVARTNRRRFIPLAYLFVIACLVIFAALLFWDAAAGGGLIGTDAESTLSRGVGYTFFVWLSVINLFTTSVFWAFMVDIFNVDQGKRMFAFIGIGGTVGALAGGWTTAWISGRTESIHLPAGMMLSSALLFGLAIAVVLLLDRMAVRSGHSQRAASAGRASGTQAGLGRQDVEAGPRQPIGGTFWEGAKDVATSPYMLGIGVWIVFMAIANTMIYFTQANIISGATDTFSQSVASFAQFDALAQLATLITQVFVTTHLIKKLGVGWTLAILPVVTLAGFAILSVWTLYGVMAIFQAVQRATRYAVSRPARETLFSVLTPSEKYKAKTVVDVFLYRGGDVAGTGLDASFAALGLTLSWVAAGTLPLAAVWIFLSVGLGRAQSKRDRPQEAIPGEPEPVPVA